MELVVRYADDARDRRPYYEEIQSIRSVLPPKHKHCLHDGRHRTDATPHHKHWERGQYMRPSPSPYQQASVKVDIDGDGKADYIVHGIDRDGDGIPDGLQVTTLPSLSYQSILNRCSQSRAIGWADRDGDGIPDVLQVLLQPSQVFHDHATMCD